MDGLRNLARSDVANRMSIYTGKPVSMRLVRAQLRLLAGRPNGNGRRGPLGLAYMALVRPTGTAASFLLAMDDLGAWLTHPKEHPAHDPARAYLADVAARIRAGGPEAALHAELVHLRVYLDRDPSGDYRAMLA